MTDTLVKVPFRLREDRIALIADPPPDDVTAGGIILLEGSDAAEQMQFGTIVHVGSGHISDALGQSVLIDLEEGDRVFFNKHSAGPPIEILGEKYTILHHSQIVGVVTEEES